MSVDVYRILEDKQQRYGLASDLSAVRAIRDCLDALREAEKNSYLGTLYRTDYEVKGYGAFPIDMLRYTSSWPKGEIDAQAIEDSLDDAVVAASPRRGPRTITLSKYHRDPEPQLAIDRWHVKFRWLVGRVLETVAI